MEALWSSGFERPLRSLHTSVQYPCQVILTTLSTVFTADLLDDNHERNSLEKKQQITLTLDKTLNEILLFGSPAVCYWWCLSVTRDMLADNDDKLFLHSH